MPTMVGIEYICGHLSTYRVSRPSRLKILPRSLFAIPSRRKKVKEVDGTIRLRHQNCDDCTMHQDLGSTRLRIRSLEIELKNEIQRVKAMAEVHNQALAIAAEARAQADELWRFLNGSG